MRADPPRARARHATDRLSDVAAARAAGTRAVGYAVGAAPTERLEGPGTIVFDDMRALRTC
ncbi:HAD hydrolase-like protein [Streptomyces sp. NPDC046332]|uniref:HAD hydrolase-like protein n=1 Tax=Streptomyces sp. NPDC046332 TaxID=3155133 RepID=UPI0033D0B161